VWTDYGYDVADRLTSVVNRNATSTFSNFAYTLDAVGNRTQFTDALGTNVFVYDALNRVTSATYSGSGETYTYDSLGNRLTKGATSYTYNAASEMLMAGSTSYTYDNNGNEKTRGSDTFNYDHENRLTSATTGGVSSSSTYNGDGLRMSHTVSGSTTNYTWDIAASKPVVLQDGTNTYVYGLELISATDGGGAQKYFMHDGLGSVSHLIDGSGTDVGDYLYDAFGNFRWQFGPANYWFYAGEQRDSESGLYYLRARYYDPASGRFLGQDPLAGSMGNPQSQNRYAYALNNPVGLTDPLGLSALPSPPTWPGCDKLPMAAIAACAYQFYAELVGWFYGELLPAILGGADAAIGALPVAGSFLIDAIEAGMDAVQSAIDAIEQAMDDVQQFVSDYDDCFIFAAQITLFAMAFVGPPGAGALAANIARTAGAAAFAARDLRQGNRDNAAIRSGVEAGRWNLYFLGRTGGELAPYARYFGRGFGIGAAMVSGVRCYGDVR
jgi:RHS repeat-associated protein